MRLLRAAAVIALWVAPNYATAQSQWPNQTIKLVVPYTPGTSGDIAARKLAPLIGQAVGGTVIVDNRGGANGNIGMEVVANSAPDGHTFIVASDIQFAVAPALYPKLPFDVEKSFATVGPVMRVEIVLLANPKLGVNTVPELVALAKSKPSQINYGSVGVGSTHQLFVELMKMRGGFNMTHVPYKGTGQALPDLLSGEIQVMLMGLPQSLPQMKSGALKALAVGSLMRLSEVPDIPTLSESGFPGLEASNYWAIWAPARTPESSFAQMRGALDDALKQPEMRAWFQTSNLSSIDGGNKALDAKLQQDRAKWVEVIRTNHITIGD
jgi:tripartite-type tricarboxylate transporter receptor subunit TctC